MRLEIGEIRDIVFSDGIVQTIENIWNGHIIVTYEDRPNEYSHEYSIERPATYEDEGWQFWTNHGQIEPPKEGEAFKAGDYIKRGGFVTTQKELDRQTAWIAKNGPLDNVNSIFRYTYEDKINDLLPPGTKILKAIEKE